MTSWTDYQDDISDAISDSMDADWSASVGARAVVAWLNEHKPLSAAPVPEGGAVPPQVRRLLQLADAALSKVAAYEADFRSLLGPEGYAQADNARSEIRQFLLAPATREVAPAEAGEDAELIARLEEMADFFDGATDPVIAETVCDEHARDIRSALRALRVQPPAREGGVK